MRSIRIGSGAGYSGDRIEPAVELVEKGNIQYLAFECLAERTIALAQLQRSQDARLGFDLLLAARMKAVLPVFVAQGVKNSLAAVRVGFGPKWQGPDSAEPHPVIGVFGC